MNQRPTRGPGPTAGVGAEPTRFRPHTPIAHCEDPLAVVDTVDRAFRFRPGSHVGVPPGDQQHPPRNVPTQTCCVTMPRTGPRQDERVRTARPHRAHRANSIMPDRAFRPLWIYDRWRNSMRTTRSRRRTSSRAETPRMLTKHDQPLRGVTSAVVPRFNTVQPQTGSDSDHFLVARSVRSASVTGVLVTVRQHAWSFPDFCSSRVPRPGPCRTDSPDERTTLSRHRTSGPNTARDIIEYALEQSSTPRGAPRAAESAGVSPRHVTLTALVAGAVTMSSPALASADSPAEHAQRGAAPQSAGMSQQIAVTGQSSPKASSAQSDGVLQNGSQGHKVQELQRALKAWYPFLTPVQQDSDYGQPTADRVRYLQKRADLTVDGIAGPNTLGTLNMRTGTSGTSQQPANTGGKAPAGSSNQRTSASTASADQQDTSSAASSEQTNDSAT